MMRATARGARPGLSMLYQGILVYSRLVLAAAALLLLVASAAPAQQAPRLPELEAYAGEAVPYRIGFPRGWQLRHEPAGLPGGMVVASSRGEEALVMIVAADLFVKGAGSSASEAERRESMTRAIMEPDSLFRRLAQYPEGLARTNQGRLEGVVREIRTLGGQRAGYFSARLVHPSAPEDPQKIEVLLTVQDGVVYMVYTMVEEKLAGRYEPALAAVRESLVLAGPVSGWARPNAAPPAGP